MNFGRLGVPKFHLTTATMSDVTRTRLVHCHCDRFPEVKPWVGNTEVMAQVPRNGITAEVVL
jgi:hypothetical protein